MLRDRHDQDQIARRALRVLVPQALEGDLVAVRRAWWYFDFDFSPDIDVARAVAGPAGRASTKSRAAAGAAARRHRLAEEAP